MADHYNVLTYRDYSKELSRMKVYNGAITAVSIAGFLTNLAALETATDNLVLGVRATTQWVGDVVENSAAIPTSLYAQRERKALVTYEGDTSHDVFTLTIPTVRLYAADGTTPLLIANSDFFDLDAPLVDAWVTAFENIARTPNSDTETVTVISIQAVGRNI